MLTPPVPAVDHWIGFQSVPIPTSFTGSASIDVDPWIGFQSIPYQRSSLQNRSTSGRSSDRSQIDFDSWEDNNRFAWEGQIRIQSIPDRGLDHSPVAVDPRSTFDPDRPQTLGQIDVWSIPGSAFSRCQIDL